MAIYSSTNSAQREVAWSTRPGIRYLLQESSNLASNDWKTVAGFPSRAEALAQYHLVTVGASSCFFRVQVLDEQPPEIVESYPGPDDFGVGRFSEVRIELEDAFVVDTNSISLSLLSNGTYSVMSSEITWSTNVLTLDLGGDIALGGYGETQQVTLAVADELGNATNYVWEFELEEEIVVSSNLFVFGSPTAQRAGQQLSGVAATVARSMSGPVRMSASADSWEIDSVTSNSIVLAYTSSNAPLFVVGQKMANLAPSHEDEIFYREVISIFDDPVSNLLTLGTVEVLLADIMESGSFVLGDDAAMFLEFNTNGALVSARKIDESIGLPTIGMDFSGSTLWEQDGVRAYLDEGCFTLSNRLDVALKTRWGSVKRFEAKLRGDLNISCVPTVTATGHYDNSFQKELWNESFWYWTAAGLVPVGVELEAAICARGEVELDAEATVSAGFRQVGTVWMGGSYRKDDGVQMDRGFELEPFETVPLSYTLDGSGMAEIALVPQIDCRLYGAAGIYLNTDPRLHVEGAVSISNSIITEADFLLGGYADMNVGLSLIGDADEDLPALTFNYFEKEWTRHYENEPVPVPPLVIAVQPESKSAKYGDEVSFSVQPRGGTGTYVYQWFHDGKPIPGEVAESLELEQINFDFAGDYSVQVSSGTQSTNAGPANLNVVASGGTGRSSGMVRVPAGTISGTDPHDGAYLLSVDGFYIGRSEVTKAEWDKVYDWAVDHGYVFANPGSASGPYHPVHSVTLQDCVKWCNALSELNGRVPCYYNGDGTVYRTASGTSVWDQRIPVYRANNGCRLPSEDEWEYAVRGGVQSSLFPWGNKISQQLANYNSALEVDYDLSDGGIHPAYSGTSPRASFLSNSYGLYDVIGNVSEWTHTPSGSWLNYQYYITKGGSWRQTAQFARIAFSDYTVGHSSKRDDVGFRVVQSLD